MKTIAAILLLSCCALAQDKRAISRAEVGCGPQNEKYEVKTDESQHPAPTPEDGKALVYFVADGHLTSVFGFDEKWEGAVDGGRYFFVPIDPGEHHVCAMLQSVLPRRGPSRLLKKVRLASDSSPVALVLCCESIFSGCFCSAARPN